MALSVALSLGGRCCAQVNLSGLSGTVSDPSAARLARAHVTAVENATDLRRETIADVHGNYSIPELPVGVYTVTFENPGFAHWSSPMSSR